MPEIHAPIPRIRLPRVCIPMPGAPLQPGAQPGALLPGALLPGASMLKAESFVKVFLLIGLLLLSPLANAQSVFSERELEDPAQQALFKELASELRCLVCQNQNIADSNATLAQDLRREIHIMISRGDTKSQIIDFMVQRYGEFVLYRPRFTAKTLVLWIGPFVLFALGLLALWMQARKPRAVVPEDSESLAAARALLQSGSSDDHKPN